MRATADTERARPAPSQFNENNYKYEKNKTHRMLPAYSKRIAWLRLLWRQDRPRGIVGSNGMGS